MTNASPQAGFADQLTRGWKEGAQLSATLLGILLPVAYTPTTLALYAGAIVLGYALLYAVATARSVADMNREINDSQNDPDRLTHLNLLPASDQPTVAETMAREQAQWQEQLTDGGRYTTNASPGWMGLITLVGLLAAASVVLAPVALGGFDWLSLSIALALVLIVAAHAMRQPFRGVNLLLDCCIPAAAAGLGYWVMTRLNTS